MLKLRSFFVTSLLTGLVITSNFGCGGTSTPVTDAKDTPKADGSADADAAKPDVTAEVTPEVKPDVTADADAPKADADAASDADVPKADAEVGTDAVDATDARDGEAGTDSETAPPICPTTPVCTLGAKKCGTGGGVQTCVTVAGCPDFSAEVACGTHQACTAGVCNCVAAPEGCTAAGTFCGADGKRNTCSVDGNSCKFVSATVTCNTNTSCKGALGSAECTCDNAAQCTTATTNFCVDAKTVGHCGADGNTPACRVVASTEGCGAIKGCTAGACVCPATGGTHENQGCNRDTDENICDGAHILTCVRDTDSGCDIWKVAPGGLCESDNGGGLTCGKKGGPAACQCPARTGGDVFADPEAGSSDTGGVFATGIQEPAKCRLPTLTKALGVASTVAGVTRVVAISAGPAQFDAEPRFPLEVPAGVLLTTADATPTPANYTISYHLDGAENAISLANGSTIKGFTIKNVNGSAAGAAIIPLNSATTTIDTVVIDARGNSTLASGVKVASGASATLTAVTVSNAAVAALEVSTSSTVTVTGGTLTSSAIGLLIKLGAVTATNTTISENTTGVRLDTGTAPSIHFVGGTVGPANGTGVIVAKGNVTADTGTEFKNNYGNGLTVNAGSATLHGINITGNGGHGLISSGTGTTVLVDLGSVVSGNGSADSGSGIVGGNLTLLTINGGTEIKTNVGNGVLLLGALTDISAVNIHDNKTNGIAVNSTQSVINIGAAGTRNTFIASNTLNGVLVEKSTKTPSESASLKIENAAINNNVGSGVHFGGTGEVFAILRNSIVNNNGGTGVVVESGTAVNTNTVFQDNDITANGISGVTNGVGGILFANSSTLSTFLGNKVHLNVGDEVGFFAIQALDPPRTTTTVWKISADGCDAASNPNSIYAHGAGNVGLRAPPGVEIDARNVHWQAAPPSNIDDYSNTGGITVTPNCLAAP